MGSDPSGPRPCAELDEAAAAAGRRKPGRNLLTTPFLARHDPATAGVLLLLMAVTGLGQLATNLMVPLLGTVASDLGMSSRLEGLVISMVLGGLALGQLAAGPISDRVGRRPVLIVGLVLYVVASVAAVVAPNGAVLLAARFGQGLGASAGLALPRAIVRDSYQGAHFMRAMGMLTMAMAVAPGLAPLAGGVLATGFGWRVALALSAVLGLVALLATLAYLPESHRERAAPARGDVYRGYRLVLGNLKFWAFAMVAGGGVGAGLAQFASAQRLYGGYFGWSPTKLSLATACYAAAYVVGGLVTRYVGGPDLASRHWRGIAIMFASPLLFIAINVLAGPDPYAMIAALSLYQVGLGLAMPSSIGLAIAAVPGVAGTASALLGALHMLTGALSAAWIGAWQLPVLWSVPITMLGFVALAALALRVASR